MLWTRVQLFYILADEAFFPIVTSVVPFNYSHLFRWMVLGDDKKLVWNLIGKCYKAWRRTYQARDSVGCSDELLDDEDHHTSFQESPRWIPSQRRFFSSILCGDFETKFWFVFQLAWEILKVLFDGKLSSICFFEILPQGPSLVLRWMQFAFFSSLDRGLFFARAHCSGVAILKQRVETSLPVNRSASTIPIMDSKLHSKP